MCSPLLVRADAIVVMHSTVLPDVYATCKGSCTVDRRSRTTCAFAHDPVLERQEHFWSQMIVMATGSLWAVSFQATWVVHAPRQRFLTSRTLKPSTVVRPLAPNAPSSRKTRRTRVEGVVFGLKFELGRATKV